MSILSKILRPLSTLLLLLSLSALCSAQDEKKIAYGILIDNTGSMRTQFETVKEIGKGVVHQVCGHGFVSLFDFESEGVGPGMRAIPTLGIEATQDEELLNRTIDGFYVQGGQTTLLDAIELIGERLGQKSRDTDKAIILITDGEERVSEVKQKQLIAKLKVGKIKVYAVGLVQQLDSTGGFTHPSKRSKAIDLLKTITKETGGRVVFPKSDHLDLKDLLTELAIPIQ